MDAVFTPTRRWLVLLTVAALVACAPQPPAQPVRAVRTLTLAAEATGGMHEFAADVRARTEARLGFRVAGKLISRPADLGQQVRAGQVLAQIDAADLKLAQDASAAAVRAAQTSYDIANAELRRYKNLRDQNFISALELERRDATLQAQKAQLDQALAQAGVQRNQSAYATLTATAAGVVTEVEADPGTVLAAGAPVLRLAYDGPRDAVFAVPEDAAAGLRLLQGRAGVVTVRPWGTAGLLPATVREVAAAADATTRTFLVKADLGAASVQLGQTVTVLVPLPPQTGVIKLPLSALTQQQGRTAVWLLDPGQMTVRLQPITVAGADGNWVVVASGLSPGQTLVTAGVHALSPGQKVKLYQPPVPDPAAQRLPSTAPATAAPPAPPATAGSASPR